MILSETETEKLVQYNCGCKTLFRKCYCLICGKPLWRRSYDVNKKPIYCNICAKKVSWEKTREYRISKITTEEIITKRSIRMKKAHKDGMYDNNKKPYTQASFNSIYNGYVYSANKRNLIWDITKYEFSILTNQNCYYCGKKPNQTIKVNGGHNGNYYYNGLDRVDNDQGYVLENVIPCCKECNYTKRKMNVIKFLEMIERIHNYQLVQPVKIIK